LGYSDETFSGIRGPKTKKKRKTGMVVLNVIPALWRIAN
jgi:hypothetical protein